jgi:hypothetical protein
MTKKEKTKTPQDSKQLPLITGIINVLYFVIKVIKSRKYSKQEKRIFIVMFVLLTLIIFLYVFMLMLQYFIELYKCLI